MITNRLQDIARSNSQKLGIDPGEIVIVHLPNYSEFLNPSPNGQCRGTRVRIDKAYVF